MPNHAALIILILVISCFFTFGLGALPLVGFIVYCIIKYMENYRHMDENIENKQQCVKNQNTHKNCDSDT